MDTRADPLGVCIHRSSFIDARISVNLLRLSTPKKTNAVDISKKDKDFGQTVPCSAQNVQGNVLHIAGSIIGGSTATIWPNADRSSMALIPPEVFTLPKRSGSCNDLVETSATVTRIYSQKSDAPRTRGANMSWTHNLREKHVDGHSGDSKSHKAPEIPPHCPTDSKMIKEEDYKPPREIQNVKTHKVHDRYTQQEKDGTEPTQVLLGLSTTVQPMNEPCVSPALSCAPRETKKIKKEEDEVLLAVGCINPEQGTGDVGTMTYVRTVVNDAEVLRDPVALGPSPSKFDAFEWSSFHWDPTVFNPQYHPPIICIGVDTSGLTDRSDGQVNIGPKPTRSAASSANSPDRSEDLSHLNISASHFFSVLDKFNEIVANCDSKKNLMRIDAMERFQRDPTRCLGNTIKGIKCCNRNLSDNRQAIRQLLTELAARNFEDNTQRCVDELFKLTKMAVCSRQREKVEKRVSLLVPRDPLKDDACLSAGPKVKDETIKVKVKELPGRILIRDESRTTGEWEAQAVVSPVTLSTSNITYWWPKTPKSASSYLPNYLPYQPKVSCDLSVSQWVTRQAEKPLTPRQCKAGYLYVYWNKATFGIYKIGFTTLDVDKRLKKWEAQCKHTAQKQYQSPFEVRNVERLERLVHAELKQYRVKEYGCHGCLRDHDEWFKGVGFEVILESIAFWTKWIMKGPYKKVKDEWLLKEHAKKGLPQLCNMLSVLKAEESKAKSITITARRHNPRPRMAKWSSSYESHGH